MRSIGDYKLPAAGKSGTSLKDAELTMAKQLITTMSEPWHPEAYADKFTAAVHALVEKRVAAGETERVDAMEEGSAAAASNVIDLTELLARSLGKNKATRPTPATAKTPKAAKTPSNRTAVRKRA